MANESNSLEVELRFLAGDPPQCTFRLKLEGPGVQEQLGAVEKAIIQLFTNAAAEAFTANSEREKSAEKSGDQEKPSKQESPDQSQRSPSPYDVFGPQFEQGMKVLEQFLQSDKFRAVRDALKKKQS